MADYSYISVDLTSDFEAELITLLSGAGIAPSPKHDFHSTLIYDERDVKEPLAKLDPTRIFEAHVVAIEVLGDGLIFRLTSKDLQEEHLRLKACGYQTPYNGYIPHMSLTYDFNQYDILACNQVLSDWAGRKLTFTNEAYSLGK
jgi:hypothetical protein